MPLIVLMLVGEAQAMYEIITDLFRWLGLSELCKVVDYNQNVFISPFASLKVQIVNTDQFKG